MIEEFRNELETALKTKTNYSRNEIINLISEIYTTKIGIDIESQESITIYNIVAKFQREVTKEFMFTSKEIMILYDYSVLSVTVLSGFNPPRFLNPEFIKQQEDEKLKTEISEVLKRNELIL